MLKRFSLSLSIVVVIIIGGACSKAKETFTPTPTPTPAITPTPTPVPTPTPSPTPTPAGIKYTENNIDQKMKSDVDVNPSTLEMSMNITLADYPERGGRFPVKLNYGSKVWRMDYLKIEQGSPLNIAAATPKYSEHSVSGWTTSMDEPTIEYSPKPYNDKGQPYCSVCGDTGSVYYIDRVTVHLPGRYTHILGKATDAPIIKNVGENPAMTGIYVSIDDSRLKYDVSQNTIYFSDGSRYILSGTEGTKYIDRNGNYRTYNRTIKQWIDTMGRPIGFALNNSVTGLQIVSLPNASGGVSEYQFLWSKLSDFGVSPKFETDSYCTPDNSKPIPDIFLFKSPTQFDKVCSDKPKFNPIVLSQIVLPNNEHYMFNYNVYGEIIAVTLPRGGYQKYVYDEIPAIDNNLQNKLYGQANRGVVSKFVNAGGRGGDEVEWTYSSVHEENPKRFMVTSISPDGARIRRLLYLSALNTTFGLEDQKAGIPYEEQFMNNSSDDPDYCNYNSVKWLRRVLYEYQVTAVAGPPGNNSLRNPRLIKQVDIAINHTPRDLSGSIPDPYATILTKSYDADLNLISLKRYGASYVSYSTAKCGSIGSISFYGSPQREDEYVYLINDGDINQGMRDAYRNLNLITLQTKHFVKGANNIYAATQHKYDEPAYQAMPYSGITNWDDPETAYRGSITTVRKWQSNQSVLYSGWKGWNDPTYAWIENHSQYDQAGNVTKSIDARGQQSAFSYSDNFEGGAQNTYAYLTSSTNVLGHTSTSKYNFNTGLVAESIDPNGVITRFEYIDPLNRLTRALYLLGTLSENQKLIVYDDNLNKIITTSELIVGSATKLKEEVLYDGSDRPYQMRKYENDSQYIVSYKEYDSMGRLSSYSNPVKSSNSITKTSIYYDELGRIYNIGYPDGSGSTLWYIGNTIIVNDPGDNTRTIAIDSLGNIQRVSEGTNNVSLTTYYTVDPLGNLRKVTIGLDERSFEYDSLSRLYSETYPEIGPIFNIGTITYINDENGNHIEKVDPRGVKTTMIYDALNRITSKTYSGTTDANSIAVAQATPSVHYYYDDYSKITSGSPLSGGSPIGRLIGLTYGGGSNGTYYKYDAMGRIDISHQRTDAIDYPTSYTYNLIGNVTNENRQGRTILSNYDEVGRLTSIDTPTTQDAKSDNILNDIIFTPSGNIKSETLGNGLIHSVDYNERQQITNIRLGTIDNPELIFRMEYIFGKVYENLFGKRFYIFRNQNNGNVAQSNYYIDSNLLHTQTFLYDTFNRLTYAVEHKDQSYVDDKRSWFQAFQYDNYSNRGINVSRSSIDNSGALGVDEYGYSYRRIRRTGYSYDASGNPITEPGMTHTYDAENRIVSTSITGGTNINHSYDGNGRRIKKLVGGINNIFAYGANGELIAEYNGLTNSILKEYFYRNGKLFALKEPLLGFKFITNDIYGSPATFTNWEGEVIAGGRHEYMPFGEEITAGFGNRTNEHGYPSSRTNTQFDGLQIQYRGEVRDVETGLDWIGNRYYRNTHGRFLSPNTSDIRLIDPTYPQRWNRYPFFQNQPIR